MKRVRSWSQGQGQSGSLLTAAPKKLFEDLVKDLRRSVTGDEERSVRQMARDTVVRELKKPDVLRKKDIFAFCLGVFGIMITEYVMLIHPTLLWVWYCALMPPLLLARFLLYRKKKMQYFMIDFCYLMQLLLCVELLAYPSDALFKLNFMFSQGPLAIAVIAWRNSLVFHSLDRVTSCFIHIFPMLVTYTQRWSLGRGSEEISGWLCWCSAGVYLAWQVAYLFETEVLSKKKFSDDAALQSSLRYMSLHGEHIPVVKLVRKVLIALRVLDGSYKFNPGDMRTKLIMVLGQALFTLVCTIPTILLYQYQHLHTAYIIYVLVMSVWNGATYYFEVFAGGYEHRKLRHSTASAASSAGSDHSGSAAGVSPPGFTMLDSPPLRKQASPSLRRRDRHRVSEAAKR
eukprot:TRINITY_DN6558_c3_g1_i1.p1 TRINITY_DN6558_c3_g1~~TRINITY_DN6558_c3_g1_i1.p1  ORF type:complete len:400 (+),score=130.18 TRINITY_DN6558_c3_g1_i1:59-1258(+)